MEFIIGSKFAEKVVPLIEAAKDTIKIIVFDWRFYPEAQRGPVQDFNFAICAAAKRGVKIKALVNNDSLLQTLKQNGVEAKRIYSVKLVHTKMMLVDDEIAIIGSHNYTQSAFSANLEVSVILELDKNDNSLSNYFKNLWPL
jgi:phosphatidylserine/phosphatidylglycerophosphate/cardiolipin synthase-like enzyme